MALLCLGFAFGVLVFTFFWVARLLARRSSEREQGPESAPDPAAGEGEVPTLQTVALPHANLGLVLGILACLLFKVSPLLLIVSAFGALYSARALWAGLARFRVFLFRALAGLLLSLVSVGLHYLNDTGQIPQLF